MLEIGKLLDFVQNVLDDILPIRILDDDFIYETFSRPFLDQFGCTTCRFPCFDMGVADVEGSVNDNREHEESPSIRHCDNNNGRARGNNISATFSRFFRAKRISDVAKTELEKDGKCQEEISKAIEDILNFFFDGASGMDSERLKRFFLILYTRRAHENFKDHEKVAESLKNKLRQLRDAVNEACAPWVVLSLNHIELLSRTTLPSKTMCLSPKIVPP
jgi:hypothetical protein